MNDRNDNQGDSFPEQLKQFAGDIAVIVREDLRSAVDEMAEKAKTAGVGAGMLSGSALTAFMTLFSLTALVIISLALAMPAWLAALIVTLLWAIATAALAPHTTPSTNAARDLRDQLMPKSAGSPCS